MNLIPPLSANACALKCLCIGMSLAHRIAYCTADVVIHRRLHPGRYLPPTPSQTSRIHISLSAFAPSYPPLPRPPPPQSTLRHLPHIPPPNPLRPPNSPLHLHIPPILPCLRPVLPLHDEPWGVFDGDDGGIDDRVQQEGLLV